MANFVLVHGAWHGGWCYRETAAALRAAGHTVFTPTHTGVGERFHQSAENITLETHIRDVCGCIEWEELRDVILVGHSYGGMVITGVADRMSERIRSLVYLDAFIPGHGDSLYVTWPCGPVHLYTSAAAHDAANTPIAASAAASCRARTMRRLIAECSDRRVRAPRTFTCRRRLATSRPSRPPDRG